MPEYTAIWSDAEKRVRFNQKAKDAWNKRIRDLQIEHGEKPKES